MLTRGRIMAGAGTLLAMLAQGCTSATTRFETPAPRALDPTPQSSAADLSSLDVDFAEVTGGFGGLTELLPSLRIKADVADGLLRVKGVPDRAGWYSDRSGPYFYRAISGDFLVETQVRAVRTDTPAARPAGSFNSAGLLVRDPASSYRQMRWLMYNLGQQNGFYGTEAKSTVPEIGSWHLHQVAGFRSASTLWLTPLPDGIVEGRLRICRVGSEFRMFKQIGTGAWQEETPTERGLRAMVPAVPRLASCPAGQSVFSAKTCR
jgi:hypothetical protein